MLFIKPKKLKATQILHRKQVTKIGSRNKKFIFENMVKAGAQHLLDNLVWVSYILLGIIMTKILCNLPLSPHYYQHSDKHALYPLPSPPTNYKCDFIWFERKCTKVRKRGNKSKLSSNFLFLALSQLLNSHEVHSVRSYSSSPLFYLLHLCIYSEAERKCKKSWKPQKGEKRRKYKRRKS